MSETVVDIPAPNLQLAHNVSYLRNNEGEMSIPISWNPNTIDLTDNSKDFVIEAENLDPEQQSVIDQTLGLIHGTWTGERLTEHVPGQPLNSVGDVYESVYSGKFSDEKPVYLVLTRKPTKGGKLEHRLKLTIQEPKWLPEYLKAKNKNPN